MGKVTYTCPILCGHEEDYSERRKTDPLADYFIDCAKERPIFAPLREREDFQKLFI